MRNWIITLIGIIGFTALAWFLAILYEISELPPPERFPR